MICDTQSDFNKHLAISALGVSRSVIVTSMFYPLEVIKLNQQVSNKKIIDAAKIVFNQFGYKGFYRGYAAQNIRQIIKNGMLWPLIIDLPDTIKMKKVKVISESPSLCHLTTGIIIGTLDAVTTSPFESMRIQNVIHSRSFSVLRFDFLEHGFKGFVPNLMKSCVGWSSFLVIQEYYKRKYMESSGKSELSLFELSSIGIAVTATMLPIFAPVDYFNTICQKDLKISYVTNLKLLAREGSVSKFLRGSPIQFVSFTVGTIFSTVMLDWIKKYYNK